LTVGVARERRLSFGEVAELYDRARPSYPEALVDDLLAIASVARGQRILEVGAGTGKATTLFAARGAAVVAIEPSAEMAAVLRRNCAPYPHVEIVECDFEHWRGDGARFPLLYAAQAWHWVAPETRYGAARASLEPGGVLAAIWNRPDWGLSELRNELRAVYARVAPGLESGPMKPALTGPELWDDWDAEVSAAAGFEQAELREYRWEREFSTAEYVELLSTHSNHLLLADSQRTELLASVAEVLDRHGGAMRLAHVTRLCLACAT
jgi:SAM-dependent methyltransferase